VTYAAQELVMPRVSTRESSIPLRTCVTDVIAHRLARALRAVCGPDVTSPTGPDSMQH
jgi:hypothetical protein